MDFSEAKREALSRARRFEIGMEVKAMAAVPHLISFSGLVYCLDKNSRQEQPLIADRKADELFQSASINKVAIAWALINRLVHKSEDELQTQVLSWDISEVIEGIGAFDNMDAPASATIPELMYDMLSNSGNTAAKVLVKSIGVQQINQQLVSLGLTQTQLQEKDSNTFEFGITTPREALTILRSIIDEHATGHPLLLATTRKGLSESNSKYGVRGTVGNTGTSLLNKTGQLNQEEGVPEALRHDVGVFYGADGRKVLYAFFSRSSADSAAQAANMAIGDIGHLLAKEAALEDTVDVITRRHLAQTAFKGATNKAKGKIEEKTSRKRRPRLK